MSSVPQFPPSHLIPDENERLTHSNQKTQEQPLGLPAPHDAAAQQLDVGAGQKISFDELGPMVVSFVACAVRLEHQ